MSRPCLAPLLLLLVALPAAARTFESVTFTANIDRPKRIALMPARAEMVRTRLNEALPFVKETAVLEDALRAEAGTLIAGLGYEIDAESLSVASLNADPELKQLVTQVEIQLSDLVNVASGDPSDIRIGRYTIGDAAAPLRARTGADGLLWLESQSVIPSKGQRALASVLSAITYSYGVPTNRTTLLAILLDLRTGEMSRVSASAVGGPVLKEPARVGAKAVREAFADWPAAGTARKLTKREQKALARGDRKPLETADDAADAETEAVEAFERAAAAAPPPEPPAPAEPPPEEVTSRGDFAPSGPGSAENAPLAESDAVAIDRAAPPAAQPAAPAPTAAAVAPRPALATAPATATSRRSATAVPAAAPPRPSAQELARRAWDRPAAERGEPTAEIVLQMLDGGPGLVVRNALGRDVLVSVNLDEPVALGAGADRRFDVPQGSHRVLVLDVSGAELARVSVLVGSTRLANAEIRAR